MSVCGGEVLIIAINEPLISVRAVCRDLELVKCRKSRDGDVGVAVDGLDLSGEVIGVNKRIVPVIGSALDAETFRGSDSIRVHREIHVSCTIVSTCEPGRNGGLANSPVGGLNDLAVLEAAQRDLSAGAEEARDWL